MLEELIRFDLRFQTSKVTLKMTVPRNVNEFFENVKLHSKNFKYNPNDELIILYPTSEGRMEEIKSNDDFEFLMKTKLYINYTNKEIFCGVEFVIAQKIKEDEKNNQITILYKKFDELSSRLDDLEVSINNKIDESILCITDTLKNMPSKHYPNKYSKKELSKKCLKDHVNSKETTENNLLNHQSKRVSGQDISGPIFDPQQENIKEELSTILPRASMDNNYKELNNKSLEEPTIAIENQPKTSVYNTCSKTKLNVLIEMLAKEGFTNILRNTIVLIRFDCNYETTLNYLKSNPE